MNANAQKIIDACEVVWDDNQADCNAFVRAVGTEVAVEIVDGNADAIVGSLVSPAGWFQIVGGAAAKTEADNGHFVIAGLKAADHNTPRAHGHVAIVVSGPLDTTHFKYPKGYWGSLGGAPQKYTTLNYSWNAADRDNVTYHFKVLP